MSKKQCMNKKLHPYYKTGIYGWLGEEVDDNDYIICPICGNVLGMNYWDYQAENDGDNKCPECEQELDYSEIYDFEDTCYFEQLLEIKESKIADLEAKLAEKDDQARKKRREFAIITLERVKRFANDVDGMERDVDMVKNYIDNQIKRLKEMK